MSQLNDYDVENDGLGGRHGAVAYLELSLLNHLSHIAAVAVMFEGINKELLSYPAKGIKLKLN